jgi:hypothetical protein
MHVFRACNVRTILNYKYFCMWVMFDKFKEKVSELCMYVYTTGHVIKMITKTAEG